MAVKTERDTHVRDEPVLCSKTCDLVDTLNPVGGGTAATAAAATTITFAFSFNYDSSV